MWIESENRVWGRTDNAYDPTRTAGGSSGGEGAADRLGLRPDRPRHRHRRLDPPARVLQRRLRPQADRLHRPPHRPLPVAERARLGDARRGSARPPRRGPDAVPARDRRPRRDRRDRARRRARRSRPTVDHRGAASGDLRRRHDASRSRSSCATRGSPRRRRCAMPAPTCTASRCPAIKTRDPAVPERDARVGRPARDPHRRRRRAPGLRPPGRRRGPRPQPLHDAAADDARLREPRALSAGAARAPRPRRRARARRAGRPRRSATASCCTRRSRASRRRHGRTVGRPWMLAPTALFNLLGLPVTEVPLGPQRRRLPLGVQVAAGRDRDHVAIAAALELERAFGGWVPPPRADSPWGDGGRAEAEPAPEPLLDGELALHALVAVAVDVAVDLVGAGLEVDGQLTRWTRRRSGRSTAPRRRCPRSRGRGRCCRRCSTSNVTEPAFAVGSEGSSLNSVSEMSTRRRRRRCRPDAVVDASVRGRRGAVSLAAVVELVLSLAATRGERRAGSRRRSGPGAYEPRMPPRGWDSSGGYGAGVAMDWRGRDAGRVLLGRGERVRASSRLPASRAWWPPAPSGV